jgi:hypothetical protein
MQAPPEFAMSVTLSILFGIVGLGSIVVIWQTLAANAGAIASLYRQVSSADFGRDLVVTFRDQPMALNAIGGVRRPRQVRVPAPKPVTHRLHHFAKSRSAA